MFSKRGVNQISYVIVLILVGLLPGPNDIKVEVTASTIITSTETKSTDSESTITSVTTISTNNYTLTSTSNLSTTSSTTEKALTTLLTSTASQTTRTTSSSTSFATTVTSKKSTSAHSPSQSTKNRRSKMPVFSPSASHLTSSTSKPPVVPTNSSDLSTSVFSGSTHTLLTTSNPGKTPDFTPGMILGVVLVAVVLVVMGGFIVIHLKRRRKKSYKPFTKRSCLDCLKFKRIRSSSTTSHGPLTQDDSTSVDIPAANHDREVFSIGDQDGGNDGRPSSFIRPDGDDDYFYDEIFEQSAFQDRTIRQSNKHLTLSQDDDFDFDDDEFKLPDLTFRKPTSRI